MQAFYQQGARLIPSDFIAFSRPLNPIGRLHVLLQANLFAQMDALALGKTPEQVKAQDTSHWLPPHRVHSLSGWHEAADVILHSVVLSSEFLDSRQIRGL